MESKIQVPKQYEKLIRDLRELKRDGQNPNRMTKRQQEQVWKSLLKYGWVYPIVTNKEGLLTDGEQRVDACLAHNEFLGPVLPLDIQDVDRRVLRQVLNKLKGRHDLVLDAHEFERILKLGGKGDLKDLIALTHLKLKNYMELIHETLIDDKVLQDLLGKYETIVKTNVLDFEKEKEHPGEPLTLTCHIEFVTTTEVTKRTLAVCEAFGLGADEAKKFVVLKDFKLDFHWEDLIYITGDSGGGKSLLLKAFQKFFGDQAISLFDIEVNEKETLVEGVGSNVSEAIHCLSMCGLNDAFLFLRKYEELSDGQKYWYKLAKLINNKEKTVWVIDEFCATLDRVTARVVAFLIQKIARKLKKTVIIATTHMDLFKDFKPQIVIEKNFEKDVRITRDLQHSKFSTLHEEVKVQRGSYEDYKQLKHFHYLGQSTPGVREIYKLMHDDDVIGVVVYTCTLFTLHPRDVIFKDRYKFGPWNFKNRKTLNKEVLRIARLIIHPKFRGIGLGVTLLKESMPQVNAKVIEVLAVMARYNPVFEHAGMTEVKETSSHNEYAEDMKKLLAANNFDFNFLRSKEYCKTFYYGLTPDKQKEIMTLLTKIGGHPNVKFVRRNPQITDLPKAIPAETLYYYWINPEKVNT